MKRLNNASPDTALSALVSLDTKGATIDISTAKFSLYGYEALKKQLEAARAIRLLLCAQQTELQGSEAERPKTLELLQSILARDLYKILDKKAEIRALPLDNPVAALTVIQTPEEATALQIGPDYTLNGLGALASPINYQAIQFFDEMAVSMDAMFENNWNSAKDIKKEYLSRLHEIYKDRTPREIYEYALYRIFEHDDTGQSINKDTGIANTQIYKSLYNFQRDAMIGAIEKIEKYNGCILADSVGLGKTYTALAIIKYYELNNKSVLVLAPKKLRENWMQYRIPSITNPFDDDRFSYTVLNHTDLTRKNGKSGDIDLSTVNLNNFGLIVIDESHNFRTDSSEKENSNTRYTRLLNAVRSGIKTKILMLTATPVNIKLKDLQSQINFITEKDDEALQNAGIHSIKNVINKSQQTFNKWMKLDDEERTTESFFQNMYPEYFTLLETLTIARSRKLIERFYDTKDIGKFPTRLRPINRIPESLITGTAGLSVKTIADLLDSDKSGIKLAIYAQLNYVYGDNKERINKYPQYFGDNKFSDAGRERTTIKLMRAMLLKRLESHIQSFIESVHRIIDEIDKKLKAINAILSSASYTDVQINELNRNTKAEESAIDDEIDYTISTLDIDPNDMDLVRWKEDLEYDKRLLEQILLQVVNSTNKDTKLAPDNDGKLNNLLEIIYNKWNHPINYNDGKPNRKILIFTAFSDTAKELYNTLAPRFLNNNRFSNQKIYSGLVTGTYSTSNIVLPKSVKDKLPPSKFNNVLTHFSPISKNRNAIIYGNCELDSIEDIPEIDVLIATDCVSEGQNLQDCDICINYDIHWNPVRIIQRFGRIDRIGSRNEKIQLVNFWPTEDLDAYINLSKRIKSRAELMDATAAGNDNILNEQQNNAESEKSSRAIQSEREFNYRARQLRTLRDHVVNPEDIDGSIPLTDINLSEWKTEAMHLLEGDGKIEELARIPHGVCAVALSTDEIPDGSVLFVLKAIGDAHVASSLAPYCPILLNADGDVLASYRSPNKVLSILRDSVNDIEAYYGVEFDGRKCFAPQELPFNIESRTSKEIKPISDLLRRAIAHILGLNEETAAESLFTKGGTTIGYQTAEFEVICYMVYKSIADDSPASDDYKPKPWPDTPEQDRKNRWQTSGEEISVYRTPGYLMSPRDPEQPQKVQIKPKYTLDIQGDQTNDGHIRLGGK